MRMLQYERKLVERGYVVCSGYLDDNGELSKGCGYPEIRIEMLRGSMEELESYILMNTPDMDDEDFRTRYPAILRGEDPEWYIFQFEVKADCLILGCLFRKTRAEAFLFLQGVRRLKIRLDVPDSNTKYDVEFYLGNHCSSKKVYHIKVTETSGKNQRILDFCSKPEKQKSLTDDYVRITEFVD